MFSHVTVGCTDVERTASFYDAYSRQRLEPQSAETLIG
jgi:catechol 2,3-dioxygenase-like lactoylglutathione lyase family enzyme